MVQVEHTSLLDRHQHSNITLDFKHSRLSGTIGYSIFMPGHHILKLGCMPSGSSYLTEDTQPSIHSVILNEGNCNHFQLFHTEIRTMRTLCLGIQHPILISLYCRICCYPVCGLHFFSYLKHAHSQHSNFSHKKFQKSLKQREGGKEWDKKTWLELLRTAAERAQKLLILVNHTPRASTMELKIHFVCNVCICASCSCRLMENIESIFSRIITCPDSLVLKVRQNASVNSLPPEQKVCPATADCHVS